MRTTSDEERRVATRVPAIFKVNYIHDGDYLISKTKDISIDGMFLHTNNPPEVTEKVVLSFSLDSLGEVEVKAVVVWSNNSAHDKDRGMAVQFINPGKKLRESMVKLINKVAVLSD